MAKTDAAERWKKKAGELQLRVAELESTVANLQSEDSAQDKKIENLQKLHAQKVRALMNSIQDLKKQLVTVKAQGRENNRSKLIEKLKTELLQQEVAINALRSIVGDDKACDEGIIAALNKGPPRVRPMSREEMRMEIRRLRGKAPQSSKQKADQAVMDLEMMFPGGEDENELIDPLQNEKIEELFTEIEGFKIDLRAKDHTIESLRKQLSELRKQIQESEMRDTQKLVEGIGGGSLEELQAKVQAEIESTAKSAGASQAQYQELSIVLKASQEEINDLKEKIDRKDNEATKLMKDKRSLENEVVRLTGMIDDLQNELDGKHKSSEESTKNLYDKIHELSSKITDLEFVITDKDKEMEILRREADNKSMLESQEAKDIEIEVLRAKVQNLSSQSGAPADLLEAERAEARMYKQKTKELTLRVVELEEEIEFLTKDNVEERRQGAALYLAAKNQDNVHNEPDRNKEVDGLREQIKELRANLAQKDAEIYDLKNQSQANANALANLQRSQPVIAREPKVDELRMSKAQDVQKAIEQNQNYVKTVRNQVNNILLNPDMVIGSGFTVSELIATNHNIVRSLLLH